MKQSNQDKIIALEKQVKLCGKISVIAIIITALLLLTEFVLAGQMEGSKWMGNLVKIFTYLFYVMPIVIVGPLFVRENLKVKLHNLKWQEKNQ